MALDPTINDALRADYGDSAKTVYTDPALETLWARIETAAAAAGVTDSNTIYRAALGLMYEQTLNNAARLRDYTAGATSEKMSQVYSQLEKTYARYLPALKAVMGSAYEGEAPRQAAMVSIRPVNARPAARPNTDQGWGKAKPDGWE